jgi:exonuclease VII large subunit
MNMKKYVLPTLVSLTFSGYALAQETAPETAPPPAPPAAMTPPAAPTPPMQHTDPAKFHQEMMEQQRALMEQQRAQMEEMHAFMEKLRQTNDPEERRRLGDEMRQRQQEMREKMRKESGMMPQYGMGPGWNGPSGMPPRYGARQGQVPRTPYYGKPGRQGAPYVSMREHQAKMEKRLENIENLLKQVVELLKVKEK